MHWPTFVYAISTDVHLRDTQDLSMLRGNRDPSTLFKIARHYVPYFFFFFFLSIRPPRKHAAAASLEASHGGTTSNPHGGNSRLRTNFKKVTS